MYIRRSQGGSAKPDLLLRSYMVGRVLLRPEPVDKPEHLHLSISRKLSNQWGTPHHEGISGGKCSRSRFFGKITEQRLFENLKACRTRNRERPRKDSVKYYDRRNSEQNETVAVEFRRISAGFRTLPLYHGGHGHGAAGALLARGILGAVQPPSLSAAGNHFHKVQESADRLSCAHGS